MEIDKRMAHQIQAFIGRHSDLHNTLSRFPSAHLISLPQGFALLPLSGTFVAEVGAQSGDERHTIYPEFRMLTAPLAKLGIELSMHGPTAYAETEYFGGYGSQGAVLWDHGSVVFGPLRTGEADDWEFSAVVSTPLESGAINQALRYLGVTRGTSVDEFAALQLGKCRSNHAWLAEARV
jgi:hypothetical protein